MLVSAKFETIKGMEMYHRSPFPPPPPSSLSLSLSLSLQVMRSRALSHTARAHTCQVSDEPCNSRQAGPAFDSDRTIFSLFPVSTCPPSLCVCARACARVWFAFELVHACLSALWHHCDHLCTRMKANRGKGSEGKEAGGQETHARAQEHLFKNGR